MLRARGAQLALCAVAGLLGAPQSAVAAPAPPPPATAPAGAATIAVDDSVFGPEGGECIELPWAANDALPADRPVTTEVGAPPGAIAFQATSLPSDGRLFEYDSEQADRLGALIESTPTAAGTICYGVNLRFFHGTDHFTYRLVTVPGGEPVGEEAEVFVRVLRVEGSGTQPVTVNAPAAVSAAVGDGTALLSWSGSAAATYVVTPFREGAAQTPVTVSGATSTTIAGLTNGLPYSFSVSDQEGICAETCQPSPGSLPTAPAIPAATTAIALAAPTAPATYGEAVEVGAALSASSGEPPPGVPVTIEADDGGGAVAASCEAPLGADGTGSCGLTGLHAGTYAVAAGWNSPSAAFRDGAGQLAGVTVQRAPLRVVADDFERAAGEPNPRLTASFEGFVAGDGVADLDGALSCATTATASSPSGEYPIECSGLSSTDYLISYEPGRLTVTAAGHPPVTAGQPLVAAGPPSCSRLTATPSGYVPARRAPGRQVPGVRARIAVSAPARLEIGARLTYRRDGRARHVDLGTTSLSDPRTRNLRLPLPVSLRRVLSLGTRVTLKLRISAVTGCGRPQLSRRRIRTRVVEVLPRGSARTRP